MGEPPSFGDRHPGGSTPTMSETPADIAALTARLATAAAADRADAAERLCRLGEEAAPAAVPLVRGCGDDDDQVREWAAAALEELRSPPAAARDELIALVTAEHPLVAYWAVTLLGRLGAEAAAAVPALTECLGPRSDPAVAQRAAWALGRIGPAAAAAVTPLRAAAGRGDPRLERLATEALAAIQG
jgi:HEAT repeat protein